MDEAASMIDARGLHKLAKTVCDPGLHDDLLELIAGLRRQV